MLETNLKSTCIGSLPEKDTQKAIRLIERFVGSIPFWPQLPARSGAENMIVQYAACLPFIEIDKENKSLHVSRTVDLGTALAELHENIEAGRHNAFALPPKGADGFYGFLDAFEKKEKKIPLVKGHITGTLTLAVSIDDIPEAGEGTPRRVIHNETIMELLPQAVGIMGAWQAEKLSAIAEKVIIFIDEPALSDYGSEMHPIRQQPNQLKKMINRTVQQIKKEAEDRNVFVGMHCCGNTTWEHWLNTELDIINFDAYSYWSHFFNRKEQIRDFIHSGKILAFGLVPTAKEMLEKCTKEHLWDKLKQKIGSLAATGIDRNRLVAQSLITPACGYGSTDVETCRRGFELMAEVSDMARNEYRMQ